MDWSGYLEVASFIRPIGRLSLGALDCYLTALHDFEVKCVEHGPQAMPSGEFECLVPIVQVMTTSLTRLCGIGARDK